MLKHNVLVVLLASATALASACDAGTGAAAPDMSLDESDARVVDAPTCSGGWLVTEVPRAGTDATYALDPDGNWHILYQTVQLGARHVGEDEILHADTLGSYGRPQALTAATSFASDAFLDVVNMGILPVSRSYGVPWTTQGKPFLTGQASSGVLARVDSRGYSHAVFSDGAMRHLTNAKGAWVEEKINSASGTRLRAMTVDFVDAVHAFYDLVEPSTQTITPTWATNGSGQWTNLPMPAQFTAVAAVVDYTGLRKPHVFGTSASDASQHLISYDAGSWTDETLPAEVGAVQDARIDASNHYYVVGEDLAAGNVVYSTNASGSWVSKTVRNVGANAAVRAWIELDSKSAAHVAYDSDLGSDAPRHHFARQCPNN